MFIIFYYYFYLFIRSIFNLDLLTHNIVSFAQTPSPTLSIGQSYSPYSRLATDPVTFACSFTYATAYYNSALNYLYLDFKFTASSSSASSSDTTVATISWSSWSNIGSGTITTNIPNAYSSRVQVAKVSDSGLSFKNYSVTLGVSTSTSTPNYYTLSDIGYYYCAIRDSYTVSQTAGNFLSLSAYCML